MPFNSSGVYTPAAGATTAAPGDVIRSATWDAIFTDISTALTAIGTGSQLVPAQSNVIRQRLTANADYYVRKDGSDSNTGTANTAGGAWLTVGKALSVIGQSLDVNGFTVVVHVQGSNVGTGIYSENLQTPNWIGYNSVFGFGQFRVLGENGTVTLTSPSASPVIFGNKTTVPTTFENITFTNPAAAGLLIYMDDFGFVSLKSCTLGATGANGTKLNCTLFSQILLQNSTFQIAGNAGVFINVLNNSAVTAQPGCVFNVSGATTYSFEVVNVDKTSMFINDTTSFTGTVPTATAYTLDFGGKISDTTTIAGSVAGITTGPTVTNSNGALTEALTATSNVVSLNYTGAGGVQYYFKDTNAGADLKFFQINTAAGTFVINSLTDAGAIKQAFMTLNSSTGFVTFNANATAAGILTSSNPTGGLGYSTGAGGTVTQATSKTTTVVLSKVCGQITMNAASLAAGTTGTTGIASFTLTNTAIAATDTLVLNHISGGTPGAYTLNAQAAAGSATINVRNNTAGALAEAIVIQFAIVKAVNA